MPITKASSNAVAPAAKGDLVVGNATNDSGVLAVGTTDQVLTVDSTTATGLKWATASAGGMTLISTTTLSGTSTTLSSIPQTYNSLFLIITGMTYVSGDNKFQMYINNTNNTDLMQIFNGTAGAATDTFINLSAGDNMLRTNTTNVFSIGIDNYTSSSSYKTLNLIGTWVNTASTRRTQWCGGVFKSNTAITSLVFNVEGTIAFNGGTILLYGVK
jgi:hypothetical protein